MSSLENLSNEQLDQVYDWLRDLPTKQVVEKVALPAPEGFGIKTHVTTLRRFKEKRWAELAADRIQAATELAGTSASQPSQLETLDTGIQIAIKHHMFERASSSNITDDQLALVSRWSHRQEKLKLEIQRVQIARERCAQNQLRLQLLARSRNLSFNGGTRSPSPTLISSNSVYPHAQPSANAPSPLPSLPSVNANPNPAHPVHPVQLPGLGTQSDIRPQFAERTSSEGQHSNGGLGKPIQTSEIIDPSALSAASAASALNSDSDRPCDHLGPLARNWEDVRRRAQIKFGITPEESARRAELRRTWKNPNDNPSPNSSIAGNPFNPVENSTPDSNPELRTQHSKLNLFVLLKEFTDSVKAAGGHLPPPPPEAENTSAENPSAPNQPSLATQVFQTPHSS